MNNLKTAKLFFDECDALFHESAQNDTAHKQIPTEFQQQCTNYGVLQSPLCIPKRPAAIRIFWYRIFKNLRR